MDMEKKVLIQNVLNYEKLKEMLNNEISDEDVIEVIAANAGMELNMNINSKKLELNSETYYLFEVELV